MTMKAHTLALVLNFIWRKRSLCSGWQLLCYKHSCFVSFEIDTKTRSKFRVSLSRTEVMLIAFNLVRDFILVCCSSICCSLFLVLFSFLFCCIRMHCTLTYQQILGPLNVVERFQVRWFRLDKILHQFYFSWMRSASL